MTSLLTVSVLAAEAVEAVGAVVAVVAPLLDEKPSAEDVAPGWVYPLVFFSLVAVTILLWLSMRKRLNKIRFPEDSAERPDAGPEDDQRTT